MLDWSKFSGVPTAMPKETLVISCPENRQLAHFIEAFRNRLKLEILDTENYSSIMQGQQQGKKLLYEADIFPNCPKMSIRELYEKLHNEWLKGQARMWCTISKEWACLQESDMNNLALAVSLFDRGYRSLYVLNAQGRYLGLIGYTSFNCRFPKKECMEYQPLSLPYSDKIEENRFNVAKACQGKIPNIDYPLVQDGQIKASGICCIGNELGLKGFLEHQPAYWELISDETAEAFFQGKKNILLSSAASDLGKFQQRFHNLFNLAVYDGRLPNEYFPDGCDVVVYGAWMKWPVEEQYAIRQVYVDMLGEELRRYFAANGIDYYYCDVSKKVVNMSQRVDATSSAGVTASPQPIWSGLREDYFIPMDYLGADRFHVINGHRQDTPDLPDYEHTVYVFGPCIALGLGTVYGKTFEAKLQEKLISCGKAWRVINCGSFSTAGAISDINVMNIMMDTPMRKGDIVVQFGTFLWKYQDVYENPHLYWSSDVFDDEEHRNIKYFREPNDVAHVNEKGYERWAEFMASKILENHEQEGKRSDCSPVPTFATRLKHSKIKNPELHTYLDLLAKHRHSGNGAIVMNANPFTLGHLHLVETARQTVDWLYVFVVEEDKSEISFNDRFAMVKANCEAMENVEVLPSGRYMISTLTFAEYFEKEVLQERTIVPSHDIRIFAEAIAPTLGIIKRFVGEEPFDNVTQQYNAAMKRMLPSYGIELVEIPRKKSRDGMAINATAVRAWLKKGNWDACSEYLPEKTILYLQKHWPLQ